LDIIAVFYAFFPQSKIRCFFIRRDGVKGAGVPSMRRQTELNILFWPFATVFPRKNKPYFEFTIVFSAKSAPKIGKTRKFLSNRHVKVSTLKYIIVLYFKHSLELVLANLESSNLKNFLALSAPTW